MENSNKIVPPHLNAEVYRTNTVGTNTLSYLDFISTNADGSVLIGCSELTGRYWNGGAKIFCSVTKGQELLNSTTSPIYLNSGTTDGCFIESSSKVLLCEDSGTVSVWNNNEDAWKQWNEEVSVAEHDDAVMAVDSLNQGKEYVTVGADGNIKVWDLCDMICIRNYIAAHSMAISGVSVRPYSTKSFATGSLDQCVSLWDDDTRKPILDLVENDCGIRCLQWIDENRLMFGDEAGIVRVVDVRSPDVVMKVMEFPAAVHRLAFNSESNNVAVCCDNRIVSVYNITEECASTSVYDDRHLHSNFVRGLAWDKSDQKILHTVGWDGVLKTHIVE